MLLKIDVRPEDIIFNKGGKIVVRVHYYSQFANGAHLNTVDGSTIEDFLDNPNRNSKTIFVGKKGGLSIE